MYPYLERAKSGIFSILTYADAATRRLKLQTLLFFEHRYSAERMLPRRLAVLFASGCMLPALVGNSGALKAYTAHLVC